MRAVREVSVHRDADGASERVTSLVIGEEVFVVEAQGEWTRVLVPDQPSYLDPAGYPGWVQSDALAHDESLGDAIARTDEASQGHPAYYMINCAHPTHFERVLENAPWATRIRGLRANASRRSHAELYESTDLDAGNPEELGGEYRALRPWLPRLSVVGGCCGTDHRHIAAVCAALQQARTTTPALS